MKKLASIDRIIRMDVCIGCGTCAGICPNSAIEMLLDDIKGNYIPKIDDNKCNKCGLCLKVCSRDPAETLNFNVEMLHGKKESQFIGDYNSCYLSNSTDEQIRFNSSSGGLITSLLIFALEKKIIDGALVTRMSKNNPLKSEPFIAKTKEEIIEASQSKYCPVPTNMLIKEILKLDGKFAVVGLPCHIMGFRKAESINPKLKKKVIYHFGLFCSHTNNYHATDFLIQKLNLKEEHIKEIRYRCRGWPGGILIKLKDSSEKFIPNQSEVWNSISNGFFFTPKSCLTCKDLLSEFADISFGDPWLREIMDTESIGKSIIITRNEESQKLIEEANSNRIIEIFHIKYDDIIRSQKFFLHFKKINIHYRLRNYYSKKEQLLKPKYCRLNKVAAIFPYINRYIGSRKESRYFLKCAPEKVIQTYIKFYYMMYFKIIERDLDKYEFER
ncbi:Coenzyme F420 hydrogenase/dehydrogenase, beta subunit C-terminal domain [Methanosarcina sp. T3]|uniref:Coenzyme F420 hydrogenase/dehydrogenase, beta subunit C-terminal domain n=1 Tax=Methanosarcina sp. T3 TaxID=3439062 RepID=UPI003F84CF17